MDAEEQIMPSGEDTLEVNFHPTITPYNTLRSGPFADTDSSSNYSAATSDSEVPSVIVHARLLESLSDSHSNSFSNRHRQRADAQVMPRT